MLFIIGDQRLGAGGRSEFCLEPARIKQQRVEPRALLGLGQMVRDVEVEIASRRRVSLRRSADVIKSPQKLLVPGDKSLFPSPTSQEVTDCVVQPKETLSEIKIEKEREIEEPA